MELSQAAGRSVNWYNCFLEHWQCLLKLNIWPPYDIVILLPGTYTRKKCTHTFTKSHVQDDIHRSAVPKSHSLENATTTMSTDGRDYTVLYSVQQRTKPQPE